MTSHALTASLFPLRRREKQPSNHESERHGTVHQNQVDVTQVPAEAGIRRPIAWLLSAPWAILGPAVATLLLSASSPLGDRAQAVVDAERRLDAAYLSAMTQLPEPRYEVEPSSLWPRLSIAKSERACTTTQTQLAC